MKEVNTLVEICENKQQQEEQQQQEDTLIAPVEGIVEMNAMVCDISEDCDVSVLSEDGEQQPMMLKEDQLSSSFTTNNNNSHEKRRRFFARFRRHRGANTARMGAPSWWTELKNVETNGCTFVLAYILMSFVLMTLMFNMREIVGDYCLGNNEIQKAEYRANVEKAMQLRRRSPLSIDQEDRFEEELQAQLYYDKEGQLGDDTDYLRHHRVPILRSEDNAEEDDADDEEEEEAMTKTSLP